MWSSRLFWRLFLTYAVLTVVAAVVFVVLFQSRQREAIESEVRQRLRDEAAMLEVFAEAAWESSEAPVEELRSTWQPKLESTIQPFIVSTRMLAPIKTECET